RINLIAEKIRMRRWLNVNGSNRYHIERAHSEKAEIKPAFFDPQKRRTQKGQHRREISRSSAKTALPTIKTNIDQRAHQDPPQADRGFGSLSLHPKPAVKP